MKLKKIIKYLDSITGVKIVDINDNVIFKGGTFDVPKRFQNLKLHKADGEGEIFADTSGALLTWVIYVDKES